MFKGGLLQKKVNQSYGSSSDGVLHLWEISWKYLKTVFNLQSEHK